MKPLKLTLTAFGPYKNSETVNFSQLKDHNLFVISGNTGSGKTTIFDGICFALYGSASGQDRENQMMLRSDFATDDTHTAVELIFSLKNKMYRILRQLGHIRQGNKSKTGDRYEFFEIIDGEEVPAVDRQIVSEINTKVEQLIGLTQDQFKQIVMLPQGEFRKFLTSETENKESILRKLFKTESYQSINEQLRSRKQQSETKFNQEKQQHDHYIQQLHGSLPHRSTSKLFQLFEAEHYNTHQILAAIKTEIEFYEAEVIKDKKRYEQTYADHNKKQTEFHQAQTVNNQFEEKDNKEKILHALNEQVELFKDKARKLEWANQAQTIFPYEQQVETGKKAKADKEAQLEQAKITAKQAESKLIKCEKDFVKGENERPLRENVQQKLNKLREFLPTVEEINTVKKELAKENKSVQTLFKQLSEKREQLKTCKWSIRKCDEQIQKYELDVGQLPDKREKLSVLLEKAKLLTAYNKQSEQIEKLKQNYIEAHKLFKEMKTRYNLQEQQWLHNHASILANHLNDGESCPVCGSLEHPEKATTGQIQVTREQLDAFKAECDQQDDLCRNLKAEGLALRQQMLDGQQELATYHMTIESVTDQLEAITVEGKSLRKMVEELETKKNEREILRKQYQADKKQEEVLEKEIEEIVTKYNDSKMAYEKHEAVFEERLRVIPESMHDLSMLKKQIAEQEHKQKELEQAWIKVQEAYQKAREANATAITNQTNKSRELKETHVQFDKLIQQFESALKDATFTSVEAYQTAKLPGESRKQLKTDIETFNKDLSMAREQVKVLTQALKDKERVDLKELATKMDKYKEAYEQTLQQWNQSKDYVSIVQIAQQNIAKAYEQLQMTEKQLNVVTDLYNVLRGQNSKKISFERYLQIEYLERIIYAANERLKVLSNGQFLLMRSDRQASHGKQSGLALDVYDGYTGQTRDVKTMSGGEKFNASLCLALGMSDVIQSFEGNISIQMMFIDEGFGSLDEASLNKAIEALIALQASGRMIGVISHVQELKSVFPAVLEVKKTPEGHSRTQFVVR